MRHIAPIASAGHAATPWHLSQTGAVVTALIVAAVIIAVLKVASKVLSPRKPKSGSRPGLYATRK